MGWEPRHRNRQLLARGHTAQLGVGGDNAQSVDGPGKLLVSSCDAQSAGAEAGRQRKPSKSQMGAGSVCRRTGAKGERCRAAQRLVVGPSPGLRDTACPKSGGMQECAEETEALPMRGTLDQGCASLSLSFPVRSYFCSDSGVWVRGPPGGTPCAARAVGSQNFS